MPWRGLLGVLILAAGVVLSGCHAGGSARVEPQCTAEHIQVECWWVLYGCMPELSPRDACMSICRDQEKGQLKICEGKVPHRPDPSIMMSVRHMRCDQCIRFSDQPFVKPAAPRTRAQP